MGKAATACASAWVLLEHGDTDGAVNRAYYAMFDAARAALLATGAPVEPDIARTHSGLIAAFGQHLVKNGPLARELGRLLNRAHEIRLLADYAGSSVEADDARQMVEQAEHFIAAIGPVILSND
jgi:uncharacterized protein (UPF0332 family)